LPRLTCWLLRVLLALVPLDGAAVWFSAVGVLTILFSVSRDPQICW
jgi:uncharacterized paraquat-inducible protein A